jgi:hypothetical protein
MQLRGRECGPRGLNNNATPRRREGSLIMTIRPGRMTLSAALMACTATLALAQDQKPNIHAIWGDDIGQFNTSAYNNGMMG